MTTPIRDGLLQNDFDANGQRITGLPTPLGATEAASKGYVDALGAGLSLHEPVRVASTADVTVAAPGAAIDGVALSASDRVLLKDQSSADENGLYDWNGAAVPMTRSADGTTGNLNSGALVGVLEGTANAETIWMLITQDPITIGTDDLTFIPFVAAATAGNGLVAVGTTLHFAQSASYTAGHIPFASSGSTIGFDADLFWDDTNDRLGLGTVAPFHRLNVVPSADRVAIRFGTAATNDGGFLYSNTDNQARLVGGADWSGAAWIARSTESSALELIDGELHLYLDTSLVVGNSFIPTPLLDVTKSGADGLFTFTGLVGVGGAPGTGPLKVYGDICLDPTTDPGVDGTIWYEAARKGLMAAMGSDTGFVQRTWWSLPWGQIDRNISATEPTRRSLITDNPVPPNYLVLNGTPVEDMKVRFRGQIVVSFAGGADRDFQLYFSYNVIDLAGLFTVNTSTVTSNGNTYVVFWDFEVTIGTIDIVNGVIEGRGVVGIQTNAGNQSAFIDSIFIESLAADTGDPGLSWGLEFSWTNAIGAGARTAIQRNGTVEFLY